MSDTNKERKNAVREAWKNEKAYVREGKGTRDWSQSEQKEIVAKGRANGYEGHHMKSVKDYPQHAGNPKNIQFLNHSEHINGAHKGNTQNATNGCFNPQNGTMQSFGNRNPYAQKPQTLSSPLTQRQQDLAMKREQVRQQSERQAKVEQKQAVSKTMITGSKGHSAQHNHDKATAPLIHSKQANAQNPGMPTNQAAVNKGIEGMRSKLAKTQSIASSQTIHNKGIEVARQKAVAKPSETGINKSSNQGINSYQSKSSGQSSNNSSGVTKGASTINGSGKSSSGSQTSIGSVQGR